MAEENKTNCCNSPLDKALKLVIILFLVYIMLGGLFVFAAVALRSHDRIQMMRRGTSVGLKQNTGVETPCGCILRDKTETVK